MSDLSSVAFDFANGEEPFNNSGTQVNESLQQDTSIDYPTVPNTNGGASPVLNPPQVILPGKCDIEPSPEGFTVIGGGKCDSAPSSVLAFTGANNYYGIVLTGVPWETLSQETTAQKYEWHNFGKVANKYNGATEAWVELVCDFRDDTLTAGGVTVVQSRYPFGRLPGGQTFDPRNSGQQGAVNKWWETAYVVPGLSTQPGSTSEAQMLQYGADNFSGGPTGRATGNNIPSVARIGLSQPAGAAFPVTRPSDWGFDSSTDWLCNDDIIGGTQRGTFATHNAVKGAFGFNAKVDCAFGEYLTVFVHIGHGSGNNGTAVPRYDLWIRYDHNVTGYGGNENTGGNACSDGSAPQSAIYAGGAHAKAYKSQTTSSTDTSYKTSSTMRAGTTAEITLNKQQSGNDFTGLLPDGNNPAWLFDNIYFPYQQPIRQGEPDGSSTGVREECCDPNVNPADYQSLQCLVYRAEQLCDGRQGNNEFGGGSSGGVQGAGSIGDGFDFNLR